MSENSPLSALRRFVRPRKAVERCELCSIELAKEHQHLLELPTRHLVCACDACAILFSNQSGAKYRRVSGRLEFLPGFRMTDSQWESLMIPVGMAFFFKSSHTGKVSALYPSPAGPMESLLDLGAWADIARDNPILEQMEHDVEALLVNRIGEERDYYLVSIDECYKLVGLIRANWRGLSGGVEVWEKIKEFFAGLKERAGVIGEETCA